jgi:ABC-type polysaccharide/polyol phosphate transport system ATPase subunit
VDSAVTRASIKVHELSKVFALAEGGGGAPGLLAAFRAGKPEVRTREVRALDRVSFEVAEGERVGIIGSNGAGKTTLLSILAGVATATSGSREISGDVHAMLSIGTVLRDDLTGRENIDLDASIRGHSRLAIKRIREEIISFAEMRDFIDRPVRTYSSGMKARLAFSMGAFIDPDILIIDETLSVGDYFFGQKASRRMKEIAAKGRIVIVVTHALRTAVELCSRCLWMDRGRIVMDGDPRSVTAAYETSIRGADEEAMAKKFSEARAVPNIRPDRGAIVGISLTQNGRNQRASLDAMQPLEIVISGLLSDPIGRCRLEISIVRVDGRGVWVHNSAHSGIELANKGPFSARLDIDPFILGADLYRLEVGLADESDTLSFSNRVFEVVDREGQFGGKPLLLYPPRITVSVADGVGQ